MTFGLQQYSKNTNYTSNQMRIFTLSLLLLLFSCTPTKIIDFNQQATVSGKVTHTGIIDCFEEGLSYDGGTTMVYCETSAALLMGDKILLGIDKPVPGEKLSPVFTVPIGQLEEKVIAKEQLNYITAAPFREMQKIEAFAKGNDSLIFATTAFDRIKSTPDWDSYNSLVSWSKADFSDLQYILPIQEGSVTSSKLLRSSIQNALKNETFPNGPPYFKMEAMAVLPGNRLIFGVRETGQSYQDFTYGFTLLETTFEKTSLGISPAPNFKKVYDFKPEVNGRKLGISDLTYHPATNTLIVLTSYETAGDEKTKDLASYLWILPVQRMERGEAPMPVMDGDKPLEIPYKGEGLCLLNDRTIFIIHDEDRKESRVDLDGKVITKKPNQTVFSIVRLK